MSLAKAHLEKAVERLRVAEKLFRDGEYEDAVSRAYYAMYHAGIFAIAGFSTMIYGAIAKPKPKHEEPAKSQGQTLRSE